MTRSRTKLRPSDLGPRSKAADYEAVMSDPDNVRTMVANGTLGEFFQSYMDSRTQELPANFNQLVAEQAQVALQDMLRDNGAAPVRLDLSPDMSGNSRFSPVTRFNPNALGASVDKAFGSLGEFALAVTPEGRQSGRFGKQLDQLRNALGSEIPSEGGFLVPETQRATILELALEQTIVRQRAFVMPMPSARLPVPAVDETTHADGHVYGGVQTYWTEEGATLQDSNPTFGRVVLDAKKNTAYTEVPNELLADAGTLETWLRSRFPLAMAWSEDTAFLTGTGVGEPLGVLNGNGKVTVTRTAANRIQWVDVLKMVSRLLPSSFNNAVWVAHISTIPQLGQLAVEIKNVAGTENVGGSAVWLTDGASGAPMSILGRPLLFTEKVPALGTASDFSLVDFSHYLIGDRQIATLSASEHYKFRNDLTAFRLIQRVDGRPWVQTPLTPANGTDTLSPYVTLGSA